jgi:diadenosine tetraphosphate (Ap4A) HIT family hydrolase
VPASGCQDRAGAPWRFRTATGHGGHLLIVPRRHLDRLEALESDEWSDLLGLVRTVAAELAETPGVDGVNIGVNSGSAAGQTIGHAHVHVIPRRAGDVSDPRGGVRWVIPDSVDYWSAR